MSNSTWTREEIFLTPGKLFDNKQSATNFFCQYGRCKANEFKRCSDVNEFISLVKKLHYATPQYSQTTVLGFDKYIFASYVDKGLYIDISEKITVAYKEKDKINFISFFDIFAPEGITIKDIIANTNNNGIEKQNIFGMALSHYFTIGDFKSFSATLSEYIKTKYTTTTKACPAVLNIVDRGSVFSYSAKSGSRNNNIARLMSYLMFATLNNKIIVSSQTINTMVKYYMRAIYDMTDEDLVAVYLNNKLNYIFHNRLMTKYKDVYQKILRKSDRRLRVTSVSEDNPTFGLLETCPNAMERVLEIMPVFQDDDHFLSVWTHVTCAEDRRIKYIIEDMKKDPNKTLEIFKQYLYSKYAINQKTAGLELELKQIQKLLEFANLPDITLLTLVEDLPEKIKAHALAACI